jgi:hypothetical protein
MPNLRAYRASTEPPRSPQVASSLVDIGEMSTLLKGVIMLLFFVRVYICPVDL